MFLTPELSENEDMKASKEILSGVGSTTKMNPQQLYEIWAFKRLKFPSDFLLRRFQIGTR
jgi:hypothetical protein